METGNDIWMNLKFKTKLQAMVAVAVVVLAVTVWFGLSRMSTIARAEADVSTAVKRVKMLNDLKNDLLRIRLNLAYMIFLEDPAKLATKAEDITKLKQSINEGDGLLP